MNKNLKDSRSKKPNVTLRKKNKALRSVAIPRREKAKYSQEAFSSQEKETPDLQNKADKKTESSASTLISGKKAGWKRTIGFLSLGLFFVGGLTIFWPLWSKYFESFPQFFKAEDLIENELTARINVLDKQIKIIKIEEHSLDKVKIALARLQERFQKTSSRLTNLELSAEKIKLKMGQINILSSQDQLDAFFSSLDSRLKVLEKETVKMDSLFQRLEGLESVDSTQIDQKLAKIEKIEKNNLLLLKTLDRIKYQLGSVQKARSYSAPEFKGVAIVMAVNNLRAKVFSGAAFQDELVSLQALLRGSGKTFASLAPLEKLSKHGIKTPTMLRQMFLEISKALVIMSKINSNADTIFQEVLNNFMQLVSFRRTDGKANMGSIDSYILMVENTLKKGDLLEAKRHVLNLVNKYPNTSKLVDPWLLSINARLRSEDAIKSLNSYALTLMERSNQ